MKIGVVAVDATKIGRFSVPGLAVPGEAWKRWVGMDRAGGWVANMRTGYS